MKLDPLNFLVIDDDPLFLDIISSIIHSNHKNASITCFRDCEDALKHILNEITEGICKYDVAIMDMNLPRFDGKSLNALFKFKCPTAKSILVTSGDLTFGKAELKSYKFDYGCSKSYMFDRNSNTDVTSSLFNRSFESVIREIT